MGQTICLFARLRANLTVLVSNSRNTGKQFVVKVGENKETGCAGAAAIKEPDESMFRHFDSVLSEIVRQNSRKKSQEMGLIC